ncbi:MAG TPA: branched-chain amino acid ABC transporter permease [Rhodocyclaceae bacterium]|nr:branched-chain amino acid ABC transporter permease [Rhodocyclaceae bacterium]
MAANQTIAAGESLPKKKLDFIPLLLIPVLALCAIPIISDMPTWATLTIAGIGMGLIIFMAASGLTLVFGLMDVMNFGHGSFVTLGGFFGASFLGSTMMIAMGGHADFLQQWYAMEDSLTFNLLALAIAAMIGMVITGVIGLVFERLIIRPVYGSHMAQILVTSGAMIVIDQLILSLWGPEMLPLSKPPSLNGALIFGDIAVERYRLLTLVVGLILFATIMLLLNRTKLGLLIRAGVQDREMVEALGYKIKFLFIGVFAAAAMLAALGGLFWGIYQDAVTVELGHGLTVIIFIVIIIGGMGSIGGAFIGAILVGLLFNYMNFQFQTFAAFSNIALMAAIILWRPNGLYPVRK